MLFTSHATNNSILTYFTTANNIKERRNENATHTKEIKRKIEQKNKLRHIILYSHDISFSFAFYLVFINDIE
jgi:hypothetical protein